MLNRSIASVVVLVAAAAAVGLCVRYHDSLVGHAPAQMGDVAQTIRKFQPPAAAAAARSTSEAVANPGSTSRSGFQQKKYDELRKRFGAILGTGYGPMDPRDLAGIAKSIQSQLRNPAMWPIVRDVLYGHTVALENALSTGLDANSVVEVGNGNVESLLDMAIDAGQRGSVKALVAHGAAVTLDQYDLGKYGATARDSTYVEPLVDAASAGEDDVVRYLLDHGASIDKPDNLIGERHSALEAATLGGGVSTVYLLLANGASVNSVLDANGYLPQILLHAAESNPNYAATVKLLVSYGARLPPHN
jgi:hypothetical protein